ncbi:MAG: SDR family oxidoreductase [Chloroflexia bacterium]
MSSSKKIALITGATSGIGKEMALLHAAAGGDLVAVARNQVALNDLKKEIESKYKVVVTCFAKDLANTASPQELYDAVKAAGIEVDYLINNAGFGGTGKFHERKWNDDLAMINLNIIALTALTRFFLPDFVRRNSGKILNVSSTAGMVPGPLQAVYYATKAYVTSFSNAIWEELSDTKVTVTALLPGATATQFAKVSGLEKSKLFSEVAQASDVAKAGYQGMLDGELNVIAGVSLSRRISLAALPFAPTRMVLKQVRAMQET